MADCLWVCFMLMSACSHKRKVSLLALFVLLFVGPSLISSATTQVFIQLLQLSLSDPKSSHPFLSFPFLLTSIFLSFPLNFYTLGDLLGHSLVTLSTQVVCFLRGFCNSWVLELGFGGRIRLDLELKFLQLQKSAFRVVLDGKSSSLCVKILTVIVSLSFELLSFEVWVLVGFLSNSLTLSSL